jgi:osmotically-inducible protein OsmY
MTTDATTGTPVRESDEVLRHRVEDGVLRRTLWMEPGQVRAHVAGGVVTLTGRVGRRTTADMTVRMVSAVPGVVTVVDGLRHDYDDTEMARSRITRTHPFSARPFHPDRPRY